MKQKLLELVSTVRQLESLPPGEHKNGAIMDFYQNQIPSAGLDPESYELDAQWFDETHVLTFYCLLDEGIDGDDFELTISIQHSSDCGFYDFEIIENDNPYGSESENDGCD